jgi:RHS repeat-associated protein
MSNLSSFDVEQLNTQPRTGGRLYAEQDADYNVTSLTDASGAVVERYAYDPYGAVTVENPDGSTRGDGTATSSSYGWAVLHQGLRLDVATGTYDDRNRVYLVSLGRFAQEDQAGYIDGANRYQNEGGRVTVAADPTGDAFIVGYVYVVNPMNGLSYVGKATQLSSRIGDPSHPLYCLANEENTEVRAYAITSEYFPESSQELLYMQLAEEQAMIDKQGGINVLLNIRNAFSPEKQDLAQSVYGTSLSSDSFVINGYGDTSFNTDFMKFLDSFVGEDTGSASVAFDASQLPGAAADVLQTYEAYEAAAAHAAECANAAAATATEETAMEEVSELVMEGLELGF